VGRDYHYPADKVDVLDPYMLLVHQGMIEDIFLDDMRLRDVEVMRNCPFLGYSLENSQVISKYLDRSDGGTKELKSRFVVGCDGAHSAVRKAILGADDVGGRGKSTWGVLDGKYCIEIFQT
jgi:phenol 2-monooxygenase